MIQHHPQEREERQRMPTKKKCTQRIETDPFMLVQDLCHVAFAQIHHIFLMRNSGLICYCYFLCGALEAHSYSGISAPNMHVWYKDSSLATQILLLLPSFGCEKEKTSDARVPRVSGTIKPRNDCGPSQWKEGDKEPYIACIVARSYR